MLGTADTAAFARAYRERWSPRLAGVPLRPRLMGLLGWLAQPLFRHPERTGARAWLLGTSPSAGEAAGISAGV